MYYVSNEPIVTSADEAKATCKTKEGNLPTANYLQIKQWLPSLMSEFCTIYRGKAK